MGTSSSFMMFVFTYCSISFSSVASANELSLVVAQSTSLQVSPSLRVEKSPGVKPGTVVLCARVQFHGLSRLRNLTKFAHTVKVNVSLVNSSARLQNVEVCFHRNQSLEIGMCPQGKWEKLVKGSWVRSISPFNHKLLDIRMAGSSLGNLQVSIEEEFFLYRVIFLVLGIVLITLASSLSKSLVFYYSSAMAVGIVLVILMVLFQGMKLLPTGRKNSVAIFVYSSLVGLGSFLLRFLPSLFRSILVEIGISEDMYYPECPRRKHCGHRCEGVRNKCLEPPILLLQFMHELAIFLLVFLVLAGAWLGFWAVRKLVLTEEGLIDIGVSHFVAWSMRIIAAVMILQSSGDPLLAAGALLCGISVSSMLRRITRSRFIRHLYKKLRRTGKHNSRYQVPGSSQLRYSYDERVHIIQKPDNSELLRPPSIPFRMTVSNTPSQGLTRTPPPSQMSDLDAYYSSFHTSSERSKFSRDEWDKFTKKSTKKALEELVSSPDFSKWAVANAERITLSPDEDTAIRCRGWLPWF